MRKAAFLVVAIALVATIAWVALSREKDACEYFAADLEQAVTQPTKASDADDDGPLTFGTCSHIATKKYDVNLPGLERHGERTIAGRSVIHPSAARFLSATRAAVREDRTARITPLSGLGKGAILVTRSQPESLPGEQDFNAPPDPAAALALPATAYWLNGTRFYSVSATRDGATVEESQRVTKRLAELVNRRPVKSLD